METKFCVKVLNEQQGAELIKYLMSFKGVKNPMNRTGNTYDFYYYINSNNEISLSACIPDGYTETFITFLCEQTNAIVTEIKPIDKVTTDNLRAALIMCNIDLSTELIDKIIDIVELIEDKGDETTLRDVTEVQASWK